MLEYSDDSKSYGETLYAESNHRIANNLTLVAGFLEQQARLLERRGETIGPDEVRMLLSEASVRVAAAGELHRLLITRHDGTVELGAFLKIVSRQAVDAMTEPGCIDLVVSADNCVMPADVAHKAGLIAGELIVNAIKYAHPAAEVSGRIEVGCACQADGSTLIWVSDDGVGLPVGFDPKTCNGVGMRTMRAIARQLGAQLAFNDTGVGLTVQLRVPGKSAGIPVPGLTPAGMSWPPLHSI